ncbi:MAG: hypothetical protein HY751_06295 [Nitrospinae bacterium]|nr:hypothetical protein [Nitrospinota bacterium]
MSGSRQISAIISDDTLDALEAYVRGRGLKKAYFIEEALLHHLQALREIPEELVIPSRLVISDDSMKQVAASLSGAPKPPKALKELIRGK